ncbi:MAG: NAD(P)H-dependent oxidoreductase [Acidimicrobiia bacterium]|nr:NAD(P)H-dependent oxidoreductase [Acidimicrobiia bacterium]
MRRLPANGPQPGDEPPVIGALELKIIVGSTRPGRAADRVAPWIAEAAANHGAFAVDLLDLRDWALPFFAESWETIGDPLEPAYSVPIVKRWNERIAAGDAFIFITPEYNHSLPAVLKNAIDSVFMSFGFRNKPAAFVSYSAGTAAGVRAIEHLAHIMVEAEAVPLRNTVIVPRVGEAFDEAGRPVNPSASTAAHHLLDDLEWWARVLLRARQEGALPPVPFRKAHVAPVPTEQAS